MENNKYDFDNLSFGEDIVSQKVIKWKEIHNDIFQINNKTLINGKYGAVFMIDLENREGVKYKIYTTKAITEYLHKNNPRFIKIKKDKNDYNVASFAR